MCTPHPRNVQLPLRPRTLLIADVTKLQPFTFGGDNFRENIETLISYKVRTDGIQQDCLYIEQGHLMTPTSFMTYSMAVDPRQAVVVSWTPLRKYFSPQESRLSSPPDHHFIPPAKSLPVRRVCRTPPNRKEAGRDHAKWSSPSQQLNRGRPKPPGSF